MLKKKKYNTYYDTKSVSRQLPHLNSNHTSKRKVSSNKMRKPSYLIVGPYPILFTTSRFCALLIATVLLSCDALLLKSIVPSVTMGTFYVIFSLAICILLDLRINNDRISVVIFGLLLYMHEIIFLSVVEIDWVIIFFSIALLIVIFYSIVASFAKEFFYNSNYQVVSLGLFQLLIFGPMMYSNFSDWTCYFMIVTFYLIEWWSFIVLNKYVKNIFQIILTILFILNLIISGFSMIAITAYVFFVINVVFMTYKWNLQKKLKENFSKFSFIQDSLIIQKHFQEEFKVLEPLNKIVIINSMIVLITIKKLGLDFTLNLIWELNVLVMFNTTLVLFLLIIRMVIVRHCTPQVSAQTLQTCFMCLTGIGAITTAFLVSHGMSCNGGLTDPPNVFWRKYQQKSAIGYTYDTSAEGAVARAFQMSFPHMKVPTLPNGHIDMDLCQTMLEKKAMAKALDASEQLTVDLGQRLKARTIRNIKNLNPISWFSKNDNP